MDHVVKAESPKIYWSSQILLKRFTQVQTANISAEQTLMKNRGTTKVFPCHDRAAYEDLYL